VVPGAIKTDTVSALPEDIMQAVIEAFLEKPAGQLYTKGPQDSPRAGPVPGRPGPAARPDGVLGTR
jgi:hypothetical protein